MKDWVAIKKRFTKLIHSRIPKADRKPDREYSSPPGYLSHEYMYCLKQMSFFEFEKNEIWKGLAIASIGIDELSIDPYFLSKDILQHLVNTDLPDPSTPYQELTPFLEVAIPTGELIDDDGDSIALIIVIDYFLWRSQARHEIIKSQFQEYEPEYRYGVYGLSEHGGVFYAPVQNQGELNPVAEGELIISNETVINILHRLKSIGLNLLLLLQEYPEYVVTHPIRQNHSGSGFGKPTKKSRVKAPRIIGSDVNIRREKDTFAQVQTNSMKSGSGTFKSSHFRRGHWRRQRKGKGLVDHQYIWIKPKLINAEAS